MATHEVLMRPDEPGIASLRRRVLSSRKLLKQIGAVLTSDAQNAFYQQRFGDIAWPATYPKQKPPTLNLAWTIKDFAAGKTEPNQRRFSNRPAGIAVGDEPQQVSWELSGDDAVVVGTVMEGGDSMQSGGKVGRIPVTEDTKKRMADWLFQRSGRGKKRAEGPNEKYLPKLRRFLAPSVTEYVLIGYRRPFLGILPIRCDDFGELVASHIAAEPV